METFTVAFLPEVEAQLESLIEHLNEHGYTADVLRYVSDLRDHCYALKLFPRAGRLLSHNSYEIRETVFRKKTKVFYLVEQHQVWVVGIFHGPRDYPTIFEELGFTPG